MRPFNGVATKYLNNYMTWFNDNRIASYHFKDFIVDRIYARKCEVKQISKEEANDMYEEYHL